MPTATYTLTHTCGHSADRNVSEPTRSSMNMKADELQKQVCPTCYRERQAKKVEATDTLVSLTGSEKQVAWAVVLRNQIILRVDTFIVRFVRDHGTELQDKMRADRARMLAHTDAKFWIENRNGVEALEHA